MNVDLFEHLRHLLNICPPYCSQIFDSLSQLMRMNHTIQDKVAVDVVVRTRTATFLDTLSTLFGAVSHINSWR